MGTIFGSIVVDPFVFYAVLTGLVIVLVVLLLLMVKSRSHRSKKPVMEPIVVTEKVEVAPSIIANEEVRVDINTIGQAPKEEPKITDVLDQMQQNIGTPKQAEISSFERQQEEKAIISYQQLLEAKRLNDQSLASNLSKEEPIEMVDIDVPDLTARPSMVNTESEAIKKFKNSEFISPIFGRQTDYPDFKPVNREEMMASYKEEAPVKVTPKRVTPDLAQSEDFLNSLKDFRKNLE